MKTKLLSLSLFICLFFCANSYAKDNTWTKSNTSAIALSKKVKDLNTPSNAVLFHLNTPQLKSLLKNAPLRGNTTAKSNVFTNFPNAKGELEKYRIMEAPVMHPDLVAKYPNIKSYVGYGVNHSKRIRFSLSDQKGLSAIITGGENPIFIDAHTADYNYYDVFSRKEDDNRAKTFKCLTKDIPNKKRKQSRNKDADDQTLRTFRLAMSATGEYTAYHGGTKADALAAMNATMTRVNGVYETDLAITMVLIANNDDVIYTNAGSDPYTNDLNNELQSTLTSVVMEANYDIGHLVHQEANSNGNAGCIGCVCVNGQKGSGFTSHITPNGDFFDIDYVAHEMGHQFGGNHTFTQGWIPENTGAQLEPGSGSTIMGYAGITGASDVQAHSDAYFHFFNIEQITTYVSGTTCQTSSPIVNGVPAANAGNDFTIPHSTAYILEGSAIDPDAGDVLTYCWEQGDEGFESINNVISTPNSGMSPSFRSMSPTTNSWRYIPQLSTVIGGNLTTQWETVLTQGGVMNMSLTVRDNVSGGGQNNIDKMIVTVDGASGPFEVTSQSTNVTWTPGNSETITWNVANTTAAPVSTPNVNIYLSIDGGQTFPITLASGVPNNGSATVSIPGASGTNNARIMVRGAGNIFYAVNSSDFTISTVSDIAEISNKNISIYPNPTKDVVRVTFDNNTTIDKLSLTDMSGKILYTSQSILSLIHI